MLWLQSKKYYKPFIKSMSIFKKVPVWLKPWYAYYIKRMISIRYFSAQPVTYNRNDNFGDAEYADVIDYNQNYKEFLHCLTVLKTYDDWEHTVLKSDIPVVIFSDSYLKPLNQEIIKTFAYAWNDLNGRFKFAKMNYENIPEINDINSISNPPSISVYWDGK